MANWGAKVSQAGFDVKTTADKNLAFTSKYTSYKVQKTSFPGTAPTAVIPAATPNPPFGNILGTIDVNIPHGLTYQPSYQIWATDSADIWRFWTSQGVFAVQTTAAAFYSGTDTTNLTIHFVNNDTSGTKTVSYHYIIMLDST